MVVFTILSQQ